MYNNGRNLSLVAGDLREGFAGSDKLSVCIQVVFEIEKKKMNC